MPTLLSAAITSAVTAQVSRVFQFQAGVPRNVTIEANFVYGSGGTSVDIWVQETVDGGQTWFDVANFHFTTSSGKKAFNLSSATPVTTQATLTDGTLASNTAVDGLSGTQIRTKMTTVGTYAGGTTVAVDIETGRLQA